MSAPITAALARLTIVRASLGFWEVRLMEAVESYGHAAQFDARTSQKGAKVAAQHLDRFHRSLSRTSSVTVAQKHWRGLSPEGQTFVEIRLRLGVSPRHSFNSLSLSDPVDRATLREAVASARGWLRDKPGSEHGAPIRALVAEVARLYEQATGKRPGLSSSQAVAGPTYTTPFEDLLLAVLHEAGSPLTLEAARSLYRSARRGKPKKAPK